MSARAANAASAGASCKSRSWRPATMTGRSAASRRAREVLDRVVGRDGHGGRSPQPRPPVRPSAAAGLLGRQRSVEDERLA
jgi:hypothetical protein